MMDKFHLASGGQDSHARSSSPDSHIDWHEGFFSTHLPSRPATAMAGEKHAHGPHRTPRKIVLCFDGTGNKFHGDDSDSNILKIFRMLDRTASDQCMTLVPFAKNYLLTVSADHYYQRKSWLNHAARASCDADCAKRELAHMWCPRA